MHLSVACAAIEAQVSVTLTINYTNITSRQQSARARETFSAFDTSSAAIYIQHSP